MPIGQIQNCSNFKTVISKYARRHGVHMKNPLKKKSPMTLHDVFIYKLQSLYDVETQLIKALEKVATMATDMELVAAINDHLEETKTHAERLENAFDILNAKPKKLKTEGIRGIIDDTEWLGKNVDSATALDASIIAVATYVEHYEMAGYGTASEWAKLMEHDEVADLLDLTLMEERAAADKLTALAVSKINQQALGSDENTEDAVVIE